jgi:predicted ATPase
LLLSGEPGVGKSRLSAALEDRLQAEPHFLLRYSCSSHYQDSAFYPIIAQLERAAGFGRADTPDTRLDRLEALIAAGAPADEDVALLAGLLSLPGSGHIRRSIWIRDVEERRPSKHYCGSSRILPNGSRC